MRSSWKGGTPAGFGTGTPATAARRTAGEPCWPNGEDGREKSIFQRLPVGGSRTAWIRTSQHRPELTFERLSRTHSSAHSGKYPRCCSVVKRWNLSGRRVRREPAAQTPDNTGEYTGTSSMSQSTPPVSSGSPPGRSSGKPVSHAGRASHSPPRPPAPERAMLLVFDPLNLKRQGRHHDLVERRKDLRDPSPRFMRCTCAPASDASAHTGKISRPFRLQPRTRPSAYPESPPPAQQSRPLIVRERSPHRPGCA
jgi:hypothetical protein